MVIVIYSVYRICTWSMDITAVRSLGDPCIPIEGDVSTARPAVRSYALHVGMRCYAKTNRDCARVRNAYEKHTRMRAKFVPYLVRTSLHLRSVFSSEITVLNSQYFDERPRNIVAQ